MRQLTYAKNVPGGMHVRVVQDRSPNEIVVAGTNSGNDLPLRTITVYEDDHAQEVLDTLGTLLTGDGYILAADEDVPWGHRPWA